MSVFALSFALLTCVLLHLHEVCNGFKGCLMYHAMQQFSLVFFANKGMHTMRTRTHTHTYIHTHTLTHTYTHTHTHARARTHDARTHAHLHCKANICMQFVHIEHCIVPSTQAVAHLVSIPRIHPHPRFLSFQGFYR